MFQLRKQQGKAKFKLRMPWPSNLFGGTACTECTCDDAVEQQRHWWCLQTSKWMIQLGRGRHQACSKTVIPNPTDATLSKWFWHKEGLILPLSFFFFWRMKNWIRYAELCWQCIFVTAELPPRLAFLTLDVFPTLVIVQKVHKQRTSDQGTHRSVKQNI